jgi:DNA repair protein RecN (Recombination protein N)
MLIELRIDNFAIINHLELEFSPGLVTFTGETGAGKSIILDAIEMLLGGKADPSFIRSGADRAQVEGEFHLTSVVRPQVQAILEREDLMDDPHRITLAREIRREGRSTARLNGRAVNSSLLREVGAYLVDIHGQSEHLSLLNVRQHVHLLDRYADTSARLRQYGELYRKLIAVRRDLENLRQTEQDAARRTDMLNYQLQEIEAARLVPGEEDTLRQDRTRLSNAENLASLAQSALVALDEGSPESPAITDLLGQVTHALASLARIDASKEELSAQAELALDNLTDLARELRDYAESVEYNPKRLEQIEERLDLIHNLKRKYGGSVEAVLSYAADARTQLDTITHAGERIAELEEEEKTLLKQTGEVALALSEKRKTAAETMSRAVEKELDDLRMQGARFAVDFQSRPDPLGLPLPDGSRVAFDPTGIDRVEFLVAPNPGEGLNSLARTASGGETSRLMLALKTVLAQADVLSTLIFDEIDQGIGGRVGTTVGEKLWRLSRDHQVMCVTHLPQLAAFGTQHFRVAKEVEDGRTLTQVTLLNEALRREELAQMLGGVSDANLNAARELLDTARQTTGGD